MEDEQVNVRASVVKSLKSVGLYHPLRRVKQRLSFMVKVKVDPDAAHHFAVTAQDAKVRLECFRTVVSELKARGPVRDYLEFGVCRGVTLSLMHQVLQEQGLTESRIFGFDSFEGLPAEAEHDDEGTWYPGQFMSSLPSTRKFLVKQGVDMGKTHLVKGWFSDTLTAEFARTVRPSIIMVDCDMYLSARQCLDWSLPLVEDRAVIIFDDWNSRKLAERGLGERKAWEEASANNPELRIVKELPAYIPEAYVVLVEREREDTGRLRNRLQ